MNNDSNPGELLEQPQSTIPAEQDGLMPTEPPAVEESIEEAPLPEDLVPEEEFATAAGSAPVAQSEVRRSFGWVSRIQPDAVAWVADFRPLGRDVQVRLNSPWQTNPGQILEYELKLSSSGGNRWNGVDTVFNYQPDANAVLALDEGKGLSAEGLAWLMRAIAHEPGLLGRIYGPGGSVRLQQQLMEKDAFPLPRALLLAALRHPGLAGRAAHRLWSTPLRSAEEAVQLLASVGPRDEGPWLERLLQEHGEWLLQPLGLEVGQVQRAWRKSQNLRWLLQVKASELPDSLGLVLLRAGVLGGGKLGEGDAAAWAAHLDEPQRFRMLAAAFVDSARSAQDEELLSAAGPLLDQVLKTLASDPVWGAEARQRLLERGELGAEAALGLLQQGATGEGRHRLLEILAQAPTNQRPQVDEGLALECFELGLSHHGDATGAALLEWVGAHPAVQAQVESWLQDDATRHQAIEAICHAGEFTRSRVQGLLGRTMEPALRQRVVAAISQRNPERWEERYLVNESEAEAWREAGAPLR